MKQKSTCHMCRVFVSLVLFSAHLIGVILIFTFFSQPIQPIRASNNYVDDLSESTYIDSENTTAQWRPANADIILPYGDLGEIQLTSGADDDTYPVVYGNRVAWVTESQGVYTIKVADISNRDNITTESLVDTYSGIASLSMDADSLVWGDYRNGNYDIYSYHFANQLETKISTSVGVYNFRPDIADNKIVWQKQNTTTGLTGVYYSANETIIRDDAASSSMVPRVSGDYIVYQDNRAGHWDIYLYNLVNLQESLLTDVADTDNKYAPYIDGDYVVWSDEKGGSNSADIFLYNIVSQETTRVTNTIPANSMRPSISGDYIVYLDNREGDYDLYLYQISTAQETLLYDVPAGVEVQWPDIQGDKVVYQDDRNSNNDIFLYDMTQGYGSSAVVQSLTVNDDVSQTVESATLVSIYDDTDIATEVTFYMSADGGSNWEEVSMGVEHTFENPGTDLRWKVLLTSSDLTVTPRIMGMEIIYDYREISSRRRRLDLTADSLGDVSDVVLTDLNNGAVEISWVHPEDAAEVAIFRSEIEGAIPDESIATIGIDDDPKYIDTDLSPEKIYYYSFMPINEFDEGILDPRQYEFIPSGYDSGMGGSDEDASISDENENEDSVNWADNLIPQRDSREDLRSETYRNLALELRFIGIFGALYGRLPQDRADWLFVRFAAYNHLPLKRDMYREVRALAKFTATFGKLPRDDFDWSIARAIAYRGLDIK